MTYHPEYTIGDKSPGVWKEVRRLEAEVEQLQGMLQRQDAAYAAETHEVERLRGLRKMEAELRREARAEVERLGGVVHPQGSRECQRQGKVPCSGCDR